MNIQIVPVLNYTSLISARKISGDERMSVESVLRQEEHTLSCQVGEGQATIQNGCGEQGLRNPSQCACKLFGTYFVYEEEFNASILIFTLDDDKNTYSLQVQSTYPW